MGGWASSQHVGRFCPRQQTPGPKSLLFELREAWTLLPIEDPCLGARSTQNLLLQGVHMSPTSFSERPGDQVTQLMRNKAGIPRQVVRLQTIPPPLLGLGSGFFSEPPGPKLLDHLGCCLDLSSQFFANPVTTHTS